MPLSQEAADRRASSLTFADISKFGQQQADAFMQMLRDLGKLAEETNRNWVARIEAERDLATDLASKLSAAKTIPDAVKVYQEWAGERLRLLTDDSQKTVADGQKIMCAAARFLMNGADGPREAKQLQSALRKLLPEAFSSDPPGCKRRMPIELVEQYLPALVIE